MNTKTLLISLIAFTTFGSAIVINPEIARADYSTCRSSTRLCLKKGDSGPIVQSLVKDLRAAGYYTGEDTDRFNSEVETAVQGFQTDHQHMKNDPNNRYSDLSIDGVVGKDTITRLCQKVRRGCEADANCYTGSIRVLVPCWQNYARILDFKVPDK
jgi:peptidoglycan hydrolase-like protein with peptidoglycan-binding domain